MTLRQEQAAVTRRRIVASARRLFSQDGYGATTLTDIAKDAGVAVQTVYAVYRSKPGILQALREEVVRQPEAEAGFDQAMTSATGDRRLALFAGSIRQRWEHGADIVAIDRDAASADAGVRAGLAPILAMRRAGLARLAHSLASELVADVDVGQAAAILDALTMPEVYLELTVVHGWSPDEYEAWLSRSMRQQLLA